MSFTCTSLSIRKYGTIVTFEHIFNDMGSASFINLSLRNIPIKDFIKSKLLGSLIYQRLVHEYLARLGLHLNNNFIVGLHFFLTQGSASDNNFNCLSVCSGLVF